MRHYVSSVAAILALVLLASGCRRSTGSRTPPPHAPRPAASGWVFVSDETHGKLHVINQDTNALEKTFDIPAPTNMLASECQGRFLAIGRAECKVYLIKTGLCSHCPTPDGKPILTDQAGTLPPGAGDALVSAPYAIIACDEPGKIATVDFHELEVESFDDGSGGSNDGAIAVSLKPATVYVSNVVANSPGASSRVRSINLESREIVATADLGPAAHGAAYSAATKLVYFACSDAVYAIGTEGDKLGELMGSAPYPPSVPGARWFDIEPAPDGKRLYGALVVASASGYARTPYVACLDTSGRGSQLGGFELIEVGDGADALAVSPRGGRMLVGLAGEDGSEGLNTVLGHITVGPPPTDRDRALSHPVAIGADGDVGYVVNGDGTVSTCDLIRLEETARISLGGRPSAVLSVGHRTSEETE